MYNSPTTNVVIVKKKTVPNAAKPWIKLNDKDCLKGEN